MKCACGCEAEITSFDSRNRPRQFISGHNVRLFKKHERVSLACAECGATMLRLPCQIGAGKSFCSRRCKSVFYGRRQSNSPEYSEKMRAITLKNGNKPPIGKKENHPRWRGGVTPKNQAERATKKYCDWRIAVYRRDRFACQACGNIGKNLHAHHLKPWLKHEALRYDVSNGQTLCASCHYAVHAKRAA